MSGEELNTPVLVVPWSRLDLANAPKLRDNGLKLINECTRALIVDLSKVDFIDSCGLGVLVSLTKRVGGKHAVTLVGLRDPALSLIRLTRLDEVFRFSDTVLAAAPAAARTGKSQ